MLSSSSVEDSRKHLLSLPILVPLDGTEVSKGILPYVSELARKAGVPLVLLGVVDPSEIDYPTSLAVSSAVSSLEPEIYLQLQHETRRTDPAEVVWDRLEASALAHVTEILSGIARDLEEVGVSAGIRTVVGIPAEEILRIADQEQCGLITMSTHGRSVIGQSILGSVTYRVVHSSNLPVLVVRPEDAQDYLEREGASISTVTVPLDGSELAERALSHAEALAQKLSLDILLVRVVPIAYPVYWHGLYREVPNLADRLVPGAQEYLNGVAQTLEKEGIRVRTKVLRGPTAQALLNLAYEMPNDLIVMTTHGRSGPSRWLLGSVAETMIRASGEPVIIVPSDSSEE